MHHVQYVANEKSSIFHILHKGDTLCETPRNLELTFYLPELGGKTFCEACSRRCALVVDEKMDCGHHSKYAFPYEGAANYYCTLCEIQRLQTLPTVVVSDNTTERV